VRGHGRRWPWAVAALGYLGLTAVTILVLRLIGLDRAAQWATVVAPVVPVAMALAGWASSIARRKPPSTPAQLDAAAEMLILEVQRQWRREAAIQWLQSPLAVRWKATQMALTAPRGVANMLFWRTDKLDQVVRGFLALPSRQLVILGEAGSGKTTLAVLFTLALCEHRQPNGPVPVLLRHGTLLGSACRHGSNGV
jgi:hypothetical protein